MVDHTKRDEEAELWETRACKGKNLELFFASQGSAHTEEAKEICAECPIRVRNQCRANALEYPESEDHGVLGGLDEWERKKLRKQHVA